MQARWPTINVSTFGKSGHTLDNNSRTFTGYTLNKFSRGCTQGGACIVEVEQFFCNLARYVTRPTFLGVECDHAQRTLEVPFDNPPDDGWLVGLFVANLSPDPSISAKIVKDLIDRVIVLRGWHDAWH